MKRHLKTVLILMLLMPVFFTAGQGCPMAEPKKDYMKAFLLSLAVPGLGQYYAGSPGYAKIFIAAELAIWGGYFYNTTIMDASRQDYYSQAALHAGVNPAGKGTQYLNAVGAYNSSFEYNQRQLQKTFTPVFYNGDRAWEWDREASRLRFRNLRERELEYENNVKFCIAGIVLNHFLSALNASRIIQKQNQEGPAVTVNVLDGGLGATFIRRF